MNGALFAAEEVPRDEVPDERYTTRSTMAWVLGTLGIAAFDLDVAACLESHKAPRYFSAADDGLARPWDAPRVWCNPPYSDLTPWVKKAWAESRRAGGPWLIAMLIPANRCEQPFWQEEIEPHRDRVASGLRSHFLPGRVQFGFPGNPEARGWKSSPPFGCVLLVWLSRLARAPSESDRSA